MTEKVIYNTLTACSRCVVNERAGVKWHPGMVTECDGVVWLVCDCPKHGRTRTLYCTNPEFFHKALKFTKESHGHTPRQTGNEPWEPELGDMEDIISRLRHRPPHRRHLPLVASIDVFVDGKYLSKEDVDIQIEDYRELYGQGKKFVLKLNAKLATNLGELNDLVSFVARQMEGGIVLLDASFERLLLLANRPDSVFSRKHVFPSLKMYVRKGDEQNCLNQLNQLFGLLEQFRGIEMTITFNLDQPQPQMKDIFTLLRSKPHMVRMIVFENERSPSQMKPQPCNRADQYPSINADEIVGENDLFAGIKAVEEYTSLSHRSLMPLSVCQLMEPFLEAIGMGKMYIRPSPLCGFVTCLFTPDGHNGQTYPINDFVDLEQLYDQMIPFVDKCREEGKTVNQSWFKSFGFAKILKACAKPGAPLLDVLNLLKDSQKQRLKGKMARVQFIVFHNLMDVASVDMARRCRCTSVVKSDEAISGMSAQCMSCML